MELAGQACAVRAFDSQQALIKTHFDPGPVVEAFHTALGKQLAKRGIEIHQASDGQNQAGTWVEGQFVRIDEGNQAARYFLTGVTGAATLEVEGRLFDGEFPVAHLTATGKGAMGLFGGSGQSLLRKCAAAAAWQLAQQIAAALADR